MRAALTICLATAAAACPAHSLLAQHLVTLDVVALDAARRPIMDLQPDDLQVFDNGSPRQITLFRRKDPRPLVQPLAPNEFSNRPAVKQPHTLVILLDLLNEPLLTGTFFRGELVRTLAHLQSDDSLYLYVLSNHGDLYPIRALEGSAKPWAQQVGPQLDAIFRKSAGFRNGYADYVFRDLVTWPRLAQLAAELATVPGRKTILWITRGVPMEMNEKGSQTRLFIAAMREAGVAVYAVDPTVTSLDVIGEGVRNDVLHKVAGLTGGRAYFAGSIDQSIRQALEDAGSAYEIGFYSPDHSWDGKYHKIRIATPRAGAKLLTERGYFAASGINALDEAIAGRLDTSEIGLRVAASPGEDAGSIHFTIRIDAQDLPFAAPSSGSRDNLTMTLAEFDAEPDALRSAFPPRPLEISTPLKLDLAPEKQQDGKWSNQLEFEANAPIDSSVRTLWLVVSEPAANRFGAVLMPLPALGLPTLKPQ